MAPKFSVCQDAPVLPIAVSTCPVDGAVAEILTNFKCVAGIEVVVNAVVLVPSVNLIVFVSHTTGYICLYISLYRKVKLLIIPLKPAPDLF